ncbi:hypothetical protein AB0D11_35525 [Streptomyces monashensis]|uniref:hypothetical protein n=1 Tax=Streptomyces monashensis TaxID=1678012 RepID=UPI003405879D
MRYARLTARLAHEGHPVGPGDEGSFAPDIARPGAGYPGREGIAVALAPAAGEFRGEDGRARDGCGQIKSGALGVGAYRFGQAGGAEGCEHELLGTPSGKKVPTAAQRY